jgi:2-C-methyl-D-erythritol 4-phosphate cytidylyltransferase
VAGGQGTRLGAAQPKALVALAGEPLLTHALRRATACPDVRHVVVVAPSGHLDEVRDIAQAHPRADDIDVVPGGATRTDSVAAGLRALHADDGVVLVHDAARCLAPAALYTRLVRAVRSGHPAVVPGVPVPDTIKAVDDAGRVLATPPRESLRAIQTPQAFLREVLEDAHRAAAGDRVRATDDAGLVERSGGHVLVVEGDPLALKITTSADLALAERLLEVQPYAAS